MDFFDRFGTVDPDTGGAGTHRGAYKRHVPEALAKKLGQLAADLGMSASQLAILALMAAHLGAKGYIRPRYQKSIVTTLGRFRDALAGRAKRAREYAEAVPDAQEADACEYSIDDVLGPDSATPPTTEED